MDLVKLIDREMAASDSVETLREKLTANTQFITQIVELLRSPKIAPQYSLKLWRNLPDLLVPELYPALLMGERKQSKEGTNYDLNILIL